MNKFLLLAVIVCAFSVTVDPSLHQFFKSSKKADILIYMKEYLDLNNFQHKGMPIEQYPVDQRAQILVDELRSFAEKTQLPITQELSKKKISFDVMWNVNGLLVRNVDREFVFGMTKFNIIDQIALDKKVDVDEFETKSEVPEVKREEPKEDIIEFNVEWVKATALWEKGFYGQNVTVGVGDTGLMYNHESVVNAYAGNLGNGSFDHNYAWGDPQGKTKVPIDGNGHGTHCSGTVAGGLKIKRKIGVAPHAKLLHCRALISIGAQILCMQWWLAPTDLNGNNARVDKRPHVVSHSYNNWGCAPSCSPQYERATKACVLSGIVVVNSAGNRGPRCSSINPNSRYPDQMSIASINYKTDVVSSFSSRGPNPDNASILKPTTSAPGHNVTSASIRSVNAYSAMSGTSMSTPNVAGGVALLISAVPELSRNVQLTNKVIEQSAKKQTSNVCAPSGSPNGDYGFGTVDYLKAYDIAKQIFKK